MKRKTNLFYNVGDDSKFITFSNYTESLTGNFLSTDTKIFPSRFLCLKINGLTKINKSVLIKYLSAYYENKLATLRNKYIDNNKNIEHNIYPFNYLLEALLKIKGQGENNNFCNDENEIKCRTKISSSDTDICFEITYISDITEQDYNGTYTDTICIVNLNNVYSANIHIKENTSDVDDDDINIENDDEVNNLCNWTDSTINEEYENILPVFDDVYNKNGLLSVDDEFVISNNASFLLNTAEVEYHIYHVNSYIDKLNITKQNDIEQLQFNCIIPLYDIVDINYKSNFTTIEEIADDDAYINLIDDVDNNLYTKNVPLGMWLYADENEESFVTLKRSNINDFSPSWSLVISSQFKPFPYSNSMPDDFNTNAIANSFATFSQVLTRQNDIMDTMNKLLVQFSYMNNRISNIEGQLKQIGTTYNIDGIHHELINYERKMQTDFDEYKSQINSYLSNLKWHVTI